MLFKITFLYLLNELKNLKIKMETKKIITKEDFNLFIKELKYGTTNVILDGQDAIDSLEIYCSLVENMFKFSYLTYRQATDMESQNPIEGVTEIMWSERTIQPPTFNIDEMNIKSIVSDVAARRENVSVNIRKELFKYADKAAKAAGVRFDNSVFGQCFSAVNVKKSAYKIIEDAVEAGESEVIFSKLEYNPQTIRVYSSQINKFRGIKTSVSVEGNNIKLSLARKGASFTVELYNTMREYKEVSGYTEALYVLYKTIRMIGGPLHIQEHGDGKWTYKSDFGIKEKHIYEEPLWQQAGFDNEQQYLDYEAKKKADIDAWTNPDLGTEYKPETETLPPGVEIVDGLKQHTLTVLKEGMPADDDF